LIRGGQSSKILYFNHPGWTGSYEGEFVLVDGLQRLTACLKFLRNEIPIFGHFRQEFTGHMPSLITIKCNVNKLKTRREVLQWYLELNTGGVVHSDEEIERVRKLLEQENLKNEIH
jgi:hypothetical protein